MAGKTGLLLGLLIAPLIASVVAKQALPSIDHPVQAASNFRRLLDLSGPSVSVSPKEVDPSVVEKLKSMSPEKLSAVAEYAKQNAPAVYGLYAPLIAGPGNSSTSSEEPEHTLGLGAGPVDGVSTASASAAAATPMTQTSMPLASAAAESSANASANASVVGPAGCQSGFYACGAANATTCVMEYPPNTCPGPQPAVCPENQGFRFGVCMNCTFGGNGTACTPCQAASASETATMSTSGTAPVKDGMCAYCPASNPSNGWSCTGLVCPPGYGFSPQTKVCTPCAAGTVGNGSTAFPCPACPAGSYSSSASASATCTACRTVAQIMDFYSRGYILAVNSDAGNAASGSSCAKTCSPSQASINGFSCSACTQVPGYGIDAQGRCSRCPVGQYATGNMTRCARCPAGTSSNQYPDTPYYYEAENTGDFGNQLRHVCVKRTCSPGWGLSPITSECTPCDAGTAGNGTTAYPCPKCPAGTYQNLRGESTCLDGCNTPSLITNTFNGPSFLGVKVIMLVTNDTGNLVGNSSTGNTAPQPCNKPCPNPATASANGLTCIPCSQVPGFGLNAQNRCTPCPPGQYATSSMSRCAPCPAGTSSNQKNLGDTSNVEQQLRHTCLSCGPSFWWFMTYAGGYSTGGAATCTPCDTSVYSATGWSWRGLACNATCADIPGWQNDQGVCSPCTRGSFAPGDGSTTCRSCQTDDPANSFIYSGTGFSTCSNDSSVTSGYCFPSHARMLLLSSQGAHEVAAADVRVGDTVQVVLEDGTLGFSKVFAMPHASPSERAVYYTVTTASGHQLQLSSSHYLYHAPHPASTWEQRVAVAGKDVRPGHVLWVVDTTTGKLVQSSVITVTLQQEIGAFVFWTLEGHATINGAAPSSYSNTFGSEEAMHQVAQIAKGVYRVLGDRAAGWLHEIGAINKLASFVKGAFKVQKQAKQGWGPEVARVILTAAKA